MVDIYDVDCLSKFLVLKDECELLFRKLKSLAAKPVKQEPGKQEFENSVRYDIEQWNDQCCFLSDDDGSKGKFSASHQKIAGGSRYRVIFESAERADGACKFLILAI